MTPSNFNRVLLMIFIGLVSHTAFADNPGEFRSACQYRGDGGVYRWKVKMDREEPPRAIPADHQLTPSQLYSWTGGRGTILSRTPRQGRETEWIQLTGKVTALIVEGDGDLHVELMDADGRSRMKAGVEIPAGQRWCQFRQAAFTWAPTKFPFTTRRRELILKKHPVVSVTGKAFWDGQHAPAASKTNPVRLNRRTYEPECSAWEVHPVMRLAIVQQ